MIRLIINADDLGYAKANNDAIFRLMEMGHLTSATLMTNGHGFEDAVARLKNFPQCSFGIHLDLVDFDFITRDPALVNARLIDADGHVLSNLRRRFLLPTQALKDAIYRECCAQIEKALDAGVPLSHIDSHKHAHTVRYLPEVLLKLRDRYHLTKLRNKNQNFQWACDRPLSHRILRDAKRVLWCKRMANAFIVPDHFDEARSGIEYLSRVKMDRDLSIEWMCHPGATHYPEDFEILAADWPSRLINNVKLISFNEL